MILPHSKEIEAAVLGNMLTIDGALDESLPLLSMDHFYHEENKEVFKAILRLYSDNIPVDILSILNEVGTRVSAMHLSELTNLVINTKMDHHCAILRELWIKRRLLRFASKMEAKAQDTTQDGLELMATLDNEFNELSSGLKVSAETAVKELMVESFNEIEAAQSNEGVVGLASGLWSVDKITNGWQDGDLIVVGGRPGMGKTDFMLQVVYSMVVDHKIPVGVFSIEMEKVKLVKRLMSIATSYNKTKIITGDLSTAEWEGMVHMTGKLADAPLWIDDTSTLTPQTLKAKARSMKRKYGVKMIFVDYLQLMTTTKDSRREEVGFISRSLKIMAQELAIPIMALCQLSRGVEARGGDKKPTLIDLKESGDIEQDADIVGLMWRPGYYGHQMDGDGDMSWYGELIIAKNRNGVIAPAPFKYMPSRGQFTDWKEVKSTGSTYMDGLNFDKKKAPF